MAKQFDGIIDAVHRGEDGKVLWARVYLRRWTHIYSDVQILARAALIARLEAGQRFALGRRRRFSGNTFEVQTPVRLQPQGQEKILAAGDVAAARELDGALLL